MARGALLLTALVTVSLLASVLPAASGAPITFSVLAPSPLGARGVEIAGLGDSGAALVAVTTSSEVAFFEWPADASSAARPLATFDLATEPSEGPLASPRMAVRAPNGVALAFLSGGAAQLAAFDPYLGEALWRVSLSAPGEVAQQVSAVAVFNGYLASYLTARPTGLTAVVVSVDAAGKVTGRTAVSALDAVGAGLVDASPSPYLVLLRPSAVRFYRVDTGPLPALAGEFATAAASGALWAREGSLGGLLSTSAGLVRVQAPLSNVAAAQLTPLPFGGSAPWLSAAASADGKLVAAVRQPSSVLVVREEAVGQYATSAVSDLRAAAAGTDTFGLGRMAGLRGSPALGSLVGLTAGDADAVTVALNGPSEILPAGQAVLTVSVGAVRSAITVAGFDVTLPAGWLMTEAPGPMAIADRGSGESTFSIQSPAGTPPGEYTVSVTPALLETTVRFTATHILRVVSGSALAISASGDLHLKPGETTDVAVGVVNRGADAVVADIVAQAPNGFLVTTSSSRVTVAAGGEATVIFHVTVPMGSAPNFDASLDFILRTQDGAAAAVIRIPAGIEPVFAPELVLERGDISAAPLVVVQLPFTIVNWGNVGRSVFVRASVDGLPDSALFAPESLLVVPAVARAAPGLVLTVPSSAFAGTTYEVSAWLEDPLTGAALTSPISVGGAVKPLASLRASFSPGPAILPGEEAMGTLLLENLGNTQVTADVSPALAPAGFALWVSQAQTGGLVVRPFASISVAVSYGAPDSAAPGATDLALTVTAPTILPLLVRAPVTVLETHGITMRPLTAPLTVLDPRITGVAVEFELTNFGNTPDSVSLSWSRAPTSLYLIAADGRANARSPIDPIALSPRAASTFRAVVPLALAPGAESGKIALTAEAESGTSLSTTFDVSRPRSDPQVVDIAVRPAPQTAGNLYSVTAMLTNAGDATAVDLTATFSVGGLVVGALEVGDLGAGRSRPVLFAFAPHAASTQLTVTLSSPDPSSDRVLSNNALTITFEAAIEQPTPTLTPSQVAPAAAASLTVLALLGLALTEIGKTTLISSLFLPLYVKMKPEEVLDQYLRGQIHGYIIANPGEHYNAIKDQLGVTNGALAYHLRVLEKAALIRAQRDGMYKRFYPVGVKIPKRRRLSSFQEAVVKAVRDHPAVSQKEIAELLGVSNQVVNYHVKQLEDSGVLRIDRTARASKLFLGPEAPPAESPAPAPVKADPTIL